MSAVFSGDAIQLAIRKKGSNHANPFSLNDHKLKKGRQHSLLLGPALRCLRVLIYN